MTCSAVLAPDTAATQYTLGYNYVEAAMTALKDQLVVAPNDEAQVAMLTAGRNVEDPNFLQTYLVTNARQLGMAGRILFPIPERGLAQRLYRIKAKTVVVWGDSDRLVPPFYAHGFKKGIAGAELVSIPEAGHMVVLEKPAAVAQAIGRLG